MHDDGTSPSTCFSSSRTRRTHSVAGSSIFWISFLTSTSNAAFGTKRSAFTPTALRRAVWMSASVSSDEFMLSISRRKSLVKISRIRAGP